MIITKVVTVSNHKGGCGKTTTAVNIAAYLALSGKRVLLIDLDPQGAATLGCGIDKKAIEPQMLNVMLGTKKLDQIVRPVSGIPNLNLAPCNLNLVSAETHLAGQPGREFVLKEQLDQTNVLYDYALIDTPPNMGTLTLNGLIAGDELIIPIQCEYYALEGVEQMEFVLDLLTKRLAWQPSIRVLLTMYNARTKLSNEVVHDTQSHFKSNVFKTIIPRDIKLAEAPANGVCIHLHAPHSRGANAYRALVEEMLA